MVFQIVGGGEHTLRAKLTFSQEFHGDHLRHKFSYLFSEKNKALLIILNFILGNITKEAGPVSMTFTIPMYNVSKLQVSKMRVCPCCITINCPLQ